VVGLAEALALRLLEALFRVWRAGRPMSPLRKMVREARREGKDLLREIQLAQPDDSRALKRLTERTIKWWGDFEIALNEADPVVYERYTSPLLRQPSTPADLAQSVASNLVTLRRIERHLAWPVPLQRFLRAGVPR